AGFASAAVSSARAPPGAMPCFSSDKLHTSSRAARGLPVRGALAIQKKGGAGRLAHATLDYTRFPLKEKGGSCKICPAAFAACRRGQPPLIGKTPRARRPRPGRRPAWQ